MSFKFSYRYGVIGVYKDRIEGTVHIYPLPFFRITINWSGK